MDIGQLAVPENVTDTKFIVPPPSARTHNLAHVIRWWVTTVRQNGVDEQGQTSIFRRALEATSVSLLGGVTVEGTPSPYSKEAYSPSMPDEAGVFIFSLDKIPKLIKYSYYSIICIIHITWREMMSPFSLNLEKTHLEIPW